MCAGSLRNDILQCKVLEFVNRITCIVKINLLYCKPYGLSVETESFSGYMSSIVHREYFYKMNKRLVKNCCSLRIYRVNYRMIFMFLNIGRASC